MPHLLDSSSEAWLQSDRLHYEMISLESHQIITIISEILINYVSNTLD